MTPRILVSLVLMTLLGCADGGGGVAKDCSETGECPSGEVCVDSECRAICTSDENCKTRGQVCQGGYCTGCFDDDDCNSYEFGFPACVLVRCEDGACKADVQNGASCAPAGCFEDPVTGETMITEARSCLDSECPALGTEQSCNGLRCNSNDSACLETCDGDDANCIGGYYCAGETCVEKKADGETCSQNNQCGSNNCDSASGLCCTGEHCCNGPNDCPDSYREEIVCTTSTGASATCQGEGRLATCTNHVCGTNFVEDDSVCAGTSRICGNNLAAIMCTEEVDQEEAACSSACGAAAPCALGYGCENGTCVVLPGSLGASCTGSGQGDCATGFACVSNVCLIASGQSCVGHQGDDCANGFCVDGVCCNSECNGTCQRCDATGGSAGTCHNAAADTDPDNECTLSPSGCVASVCSGTAAACKWLDSTTVCRAATGDCDTAEVCPGNGGCPVDSVPSSSTTCPSGADSNACTDDRCSGVATDKTCQHINDNTNTCSDGNACTSGESCSAGTCGNSTAVTCNDNNDCTDDSCNSSTGCVFTADNSNTCSDSNACTSNDACNNGVCSGTAKTCDDSNACTDDSCNTSNGNCVFTNDNTNTCNDGNACTLSDACSNGSCTGTAKNCSDSNACTDDSCNTSTGACINTNDNTNTCNDGNACTSGDACNNGSCGGSAITCNDSNPCTDDSCNTSTGCVYTNDNNNSCSDGDSCTAGDSCYNGSCGGDPIACCNDPDPCCGSSNPCCGSSDPCCGVSCESGYHCSGGSCVSDGGGDPCAGADCNPNSPYCSEVCCPYCY